MSRPPLVSLGLALLVATPLAAQRPEDRSAAELRALLARADAQLRPFSVRQTAQQAASAPLRAGRIAQSGDVALVVFAAAVTADAVALAHAADSALASFGVVPPAFVRSLVFVMPNTAGAAELIAGSPLAGRRVVPMHVDNVKNVRPDRRNIVLGPLLAAYVASLDAAWRSWLAGGAENFGNAWSSRTAAERGLEALTEPAYAVGERCLAESAAGCRLYLGLDAEPDPYAVRYLGAELRRHLGGLSFSLDEGGCLGGSDDGCAGLAARSGRVHPVPASSDARRSFLWSVRVMDGPQTLARALADSTGSIGERLARATGVPVDSLALRWREWALSTGRPERVRAGFGDIAAALGSVALLAFLATRRGRWL